MAHAQAMSPLPLTMTHLYVEHRHAELRAAATRPARRPRRKSRLRRWANGWFDRAVPNSPR
jgi:hypothetical protein